MMPLSALSDFMSLQDVRSHTTNELLKMIEDILSLDSNLHPIHPDLFDAACPGRQVSNATITVAIRHETLRHS